MNRLVNVGMSDMIGRYVLSVINTIDVYLAVAHHYQPSPSAIGIANRFGQLLLPANPRYGPRVMAMAMADGERSPYSVGNLYAVESPCKWTR